jgi:hypothetical protein
MSLHTVGSDATYILPASMDSIPEAFRSNRSAKPIPCVLQTVNIPALSGNASAGGTSVIQIPCGASAGIMMNPYLSFKVKLTGTKDKKVQFKGASSSGSALISRLSTYVNSVQVDNIQNADQVYDCLFSHSTSADWLAHDGKVLMLAGVEDEFKDVTEITRNIVLPMIGMLGSQQAFPLYLINGQLQIQLDYNTINRSVFSADAAVSAMVISDVQLVYDRLQPEQAFIESVRGAMAAGQNFVYAYTNYQSVPKASAANSTFNYGLNVSSLRGVIQTTVLTDDLTDAKAQGKSVANGLSQFRVSLDGRLVNSNTLNTTSSPALCFAEAQKCLSRVFDASITDNCTNTTYLTNSFFIGTSAQRVNEGLAFAGSPVSVASVETTAANNTTHTDFLLFISDYQLLVDASGSVQLVR